MSRTPKAMPLGVLLVAGMCAACSTAQTEPPAALGSQVAEAAPEPPEPTPEVEERDPSARERWDSPFAVSGTGRAVIREPREVVVLGADSAIAAALAERPPERRAAASLARPGDEPRPTGSSAAERESAGSPPAGAAAAQQPLASVRRDEEDVRPPTEVVDRAPTTPAPGESAAFTLHRVEPGDTWSRIVIRYRVTSEALAAANPDVDPNLIRTGQVIRVPQPAPGAASRSHRVGPGETLRGIATRYNVTADEIRRINGMTDERVTMGQTLIIPPPRGQSGDGR